MNGHELSKASLGDTLLPNEETTKSLDNQEFESWAAVVAGCLQPAPFVPPTALGLGTPETVAPEGWRASVGALTPGDASAFAATGSVATATGTETGTVDAMQRIQLRVNTKECGEVALVVERAEEGLRVTIAVVDSNAETALQHEASVMRRALENGGQSVASLKIVRMDQSGTELAKGQLTLSQDRRRARKANGSGSKSNAAKRTSRRLIIIG